MVIEDDEAPSNDQTVAEAASTTPTTTGPAQPATIDNKNVYPWWKEYPKYRDNEYFRKAYVIQGNNGEYDVTVDVGDIPSSTFYYSIYVVDEKSSRLEIKRQPVSFTRDPDQPFTTVEFHISVPEELLPERGLVKAEIYNLINGKKDSDHAIDTLLEKF